MISSILKIVGNISGWFSPERRDKAKREKREAIKKELRKLKRRKWSVEIAQKVVRLERELEKIENSLGA